MEEPNKGNRTGWFRKAGWGIFSHYLAAPASSVGGPDSFSSGNWNRRVDSFDVKRFAAQLESVGAGYYGITIGQNSGHYCSPNATYDSIVGRKPSLLSRRDLVADLADALAEKNIPLLVYLPSGIGFDPLAKKGFHGDEVKGRQSQRQAAFQLKWESVIREWSLRWGKNVKGWWIDGCYSADAMYRYPEPPNFESFAAAMRAGNPDSIVTFNPGNFYPIRPLSLAEDYTAGEMDGFVYLGAWGNGVYKPTDGYVEHAQLHCWTFMGDWWGQGHPRFPEEFVVGYTKYLTHHGGVLTWDVPISDDGLFPNPFVDQLLKIKTATR